MPSVLLQPMRDGAEVVRDYNRLGLTLRNHPLTFLRGDLQTRGIISCQHALAAKDGKRLTVAGLVLVRQRPGSAEGVVFMTLEDETANMNVIIWPDLFDANRRVVLGGQMLAVTGMLQKEGDVVHLVAKEITDLSGLLADVGNRSSTESPHASASVGERIVVRSRNFH
ncbi:Error-prone DNA polymerase 1 [Gluconacetobacter sp. SXCC-1]|nr:Error-prone DNA polymerase 1 [Gluconacetobacter sp. SXCC-1]